MMQGEFKETKETNQTSDSGPRSASNWPQSGETDRKHLKQIFLLLCSSNFPERQDCLSLWSTQMVWGRFVALLHLFPHEHSCKTQQLMSVYLPVKRKSELRPRSHHLLLLPQHSRVVLLFYR